MNRNRWIIVILIFGVLTLGIADVAVAKKKKNKVDGKALYVEFCKSCHAEGSDNGEYTPMTLIQEQWERFFDEQFEATHSGVMYPSHDNKAVTEVISEKDLEAIKKFSIKGAADSEHPMTCG